MNKKTFDAIIWEMEQRGYRKDTLTAGQFEAYLANRSKLK